MSSVIPSGAPQRPTTPPKRRIRNFLLDPRFQLKYTMQVVVVTVAVASVLGYFAYQFSVGQTEAMNVELLMQPDLAPEVASDLESMAKQTDRNVLMSIIAGIAILAIALGLTGIVITHKMAGPVFKLKRLLREVASGDLGEKPGLRKGDELQDLFAAFQEMVSSLRERKQEDLETVRQAIESGSVEGLRELEQRMKTSLGEVVDEHSRSSLPPG